MAKLMQVIVVERCKGAGTEADPSRLVIEYWSTDGKLLASHDPVADGRARRPS
jgi:hypothetical protein